MIIKIGYYIISTPFLLLDKCGKFEILIIMCIYVLNYLIYFTEILKYILAINRP